MTTLAPGPDGEPEFPDQEGAAVWLFPGNATRWLLMTQQKRLGIPVFVEVDDNYTQSPPQFGEARSAWQIRHSKAFPDRHSYEGHVRITRNVADGVICSTPYLAGIYQRLHGNVHVCRNAVDPDDWEPDPPHQPDETLRVGFAGSWSHELDIRQLRRAFDWLSRQPNVEVMMFGPDPRWGFEYTHVPWTNSLEEYRKSVRRLDVMVCPIMPGAWSNCKSDIKAMEGVMAGAVPVVSRTEPFSPWWRDGAPCFSYETEKGLLKTVKHLVTVEGRREARQAWLEAYRYVTTERNIRGSVSEWRDALSSVSGDPLRHLFRVSPSSSLPTDPTVWLRSSGRGGRSLRSTA